MQFTINKKHVTCFKFTVQASVKKRQCLQHLHRGIKQF